MDIQLTFTTPRNTTSFIDQSISIDNNQGIVVNLLSNDAFSESIYNRVINILKAKEKTDFEDGFINNFREVYSTITSNSLDVEYKSDIKYSSYLRDIYASAFRNLVSVGSIIAEISTTDEQKNEAQKSILLKALSDELKLYNSYVGNDRSNLIQIFQDVIRELAAINCKDCVVELTNDKTFKVKLLLPTDDLLIVTKPYVFSPDLRFDEVVYSLFHNKVCLLSGVDNICELTRKINAYLDNK